MIDKVLISRALGGCRHPLRCLSQVVPAGTHDRYRASMPPVEAEPVLILLPAERMFNLDHCGVQDIVSDGSYGDSEDGDRRSKHNKL
jgi:hypothetical protein